MRFACQGSGLPTARRIIEELRSLAGGPQAARSRGFRLACFEIDYGFADGDLNRVLGDTTDVGSRISGADPRHAWPFLTTAVRASIEAGGAAALRSTLAGAAAGLARPGPAEHAHAAVFDAEMARAEGHSDVVAWDAAAEAWATLGQPYPHAYALLRSAAAWMPRDRNRATPACRGGSQQP